MTVEPLFTCASVPVSITDDTEPPARIELLPIGVLTLRGHVTNTGPVTANVTDAAAIIARSMSEAPGGM